MNTAPDLALPVSAWRIWHVAVERDVPELVAPARRTPWPARAATTATCGAGCADPPGPWCHCGLYALAAFPGRTSWGAADTTAIGCTALWGRVIEATGGWRAEHGYPLVLLVPAVEPEADRDAWRDARLSPTLRRHLQRMLEAEAALPLDEPAAAAMSRRLAERYAIPVYPLPASLPSLHREDPGIAGAAAAVRDEAVAGLAARRAGDARARGRLDDAVAELSAALAG